MLISNEEQKEKMSKQDLMLKELIESNKEKKSMLSELIKSNKEQKTMLSKLIKLNKNQKEFNKKVFNSIDNALINDSNKSNTNNNQ